MLSSVLNSEQAIQVKYLQRHISISLPSKPKLIRNQELPGAQIEITFYHSIV